MSKGKENKINQLGINPSTANARLRKMLIFDFAKKCGEDICFQCGKKIENIEEFSIEHKIPYLDSENPIGLFFDLNNIAYSHLTCNIIAGRKNVVKIYDSAKIQGSTELKNRTKRYRARFKHLGILYEAGYHLTKKDAHDAYLKIKNHVLTSK